jgi:hypothetical protein
VSLIESYEPYQHMAQNRMQFQLVVRRFARFAEFGGVWGWGDFKGDNRTFSTSERVTYKTAMLLVFDLSQGKVTEGPVGHTTGTRRDSDDAKAFAEVSVRTIYAKGEAGRISLYLSMSGSNPGNEGVWGRVVGLVSPNIDSHFVFTASLKEGNLFVGGELFGDPFPDAEVFIRDNGRGAHMLSTYRTPYGPTKGPAVGLPGAGNKILLGSLKEGIVLDEQCRFIGTTSWTS